MTVQLEEERRRMQAQRTLELLQSHNVDVRSELQQQISQIQEKSLKQIQFYSKEQCLKSHITYKTGSDIPTSVQKINENIVVGFKAGKLIALDSKLENEIHKHEALDRKQFNQVIKELVPSELSHVFSQASSNFSFYGSVIRIQLVDKVMGFNILISVQLKHGSLFVFVNESLSPGYYIYFPSSGLASAQVSASTGYMLVSTPENDLLYVDVINRHAITELMGHTALINDIQHFPGGIQTLTCGFDSTVRIFDCERQGSLIYEFPGRCPDKVAILNQSYFLAAGDELSLFSRDKRRPIFSIKAIDLIDIPEDEQSYAATQFTALGALPGVNVVVTAVNGTLIVIQLDLEALEGPEGRSGGLEGRQSVSRALDSQELPLQVTFSLNLNPGYVNSLHLFLNQKTGDLTALYCFGAERSTDRIAPVQAEQHVGQIILGKVVRKSRFN